MGTVAKRVIELVVLFSPNRQQQTNSRWRDRAARMWAVAAAGRSAAAFFRFNNVPLAAQAAFQGFSSASGMPDREIMASGVQVVDLSKSNC